MNSYTPRPLVKRSVLDRAKSAGVNGDTALRDLAFNQLLARIDSHDPGSFMLKGAQALRVRQVSARATKDLDMRSGAATIGQAVATLRDAIHHDLGDGILFQVSREPSALGHDQTGGYAGINIGIEALLQGEYIASVSIDLVTGREPSGLVARLPRPMALTLPGITEACVDTYPVEDHIADKVRATMTLYGDRPSSRPRDLYDLVAFALRSEPEALALGVALEEERVRRGIASTASFNVPLNWQAGWGALLTTYPDQDFPTDFGEALGLVRRLLEPVLGGEVTRGRWDPAAASWAVERS